MYREVYRYSFRSDVDFEDVTASLALALFAIESLHGETEVELAGVHALDDSSRSCVVDSGSQIGSELNRVFYGYLRRELAADKFEIERLPRQERRPPSAVAA